MSDDYALLAQDEIIELAVKHNVVLPNFKINGRFKRLLGRYSVNGKNNSGPTIELADTSYIENWVLRTVGDDLGRSQTKAIVLDIARHEFAHHLEWVAHKRVSHSAVWRSYAKLLGAYPKAASGAAERLNWAGTRRVNDEL